MGMFDNWMNNGSTQVAETKPPVKETPVTGADTANAGANGQNNDGVDDAMIASIWDEPKPADKTKDAPAGGGNNQPGNNGAALTPEQQVGQFLNSQGLGEFKLTDPEKEALKNGDFEGTMARLNQRVQQAYIKSMQGMNALVDKKVQDAVTKAVGDSKEYVESKELRSMLRTALPFTADPAIAPVAETVFKRFLQQTGATREKALASTKKYFEKTAELVTGGVNKNSSGTFRANNSGPVGDTDWLTALTGKQG